MKLRAGDWVEVRNKEEILATLDSNARLEGLPFMPQMFDYCGQRFRVHKRAHKTCDTVSGHYVGRQLPNAVHLEHRCDGKAYGGCQAGCLLFWKEAWLKPLANEGADGLPEDRDRHKDQRAHGPLCTEEDVWKATSVRNGQAGVETRYACQATELLTYTSPLKWWDARQYVEDLSSGNVSAGRMLSGFIYVILYYGSLANRYTLGRPARWLHDVLRRLWRGSPMPRARGRLALGSATPASNLGLQPGDLVRVKPLEEILATIDAGNYNRGLYFDAEMTPYCGKTYRVHTRVERFIDEKTGKMRKLKTPAVILDGVCCQARYSDHRMFCPRGIYTWWREVWLERIPENVKSKS
jgi:hypothetical protein